MKNRILYLGDTALSRQASYLAGIMHFYEIDFDYLGSDNHFLSLFLRRDYNLIIISDYPASNFSVEQMKIIAEKVKDGMGLFMIGGWESFTGSGGDYYNTYFADILPVIMSDTDDRINFSSPCLIVKEQEHEITQSLPFERDIPTIGGLNAFGVIRGAAVLLSAIVFKASRSNNVVDFKKGRQYPLLVVGGFGLGRTAAFASDVAPHWVGPFVDWGDQRVKACANGAETIVVGNWYAQFFMNVINWLCAKNNETMNVI